MESIKIRGHHLLCMQGFQGYGYSPDFTRNLQEIINRLDSQPDSLVKLVAEHDAICACCPYLADSECYKDEGSELQVRAMDLAVLQALGLKPGASCNAAALKALISSQLKTGLQLETICGDCQWKEICLAGAK